MSLFNELKRRNVFRVGAAYAIFAWVLIQIIDTVLPTFDAPRWIIQTVTFLIILGFPVTLFLAWIFELTPQGLKTDAEAQSEESITHAGEGDFARVKSQTLNAIIMGLMVMAVGFLMVDRFVIGDLSTETNPVAAAANNFLLPTHRVSLLLPPEAPMAFIATPNRSLAISPDGQTVVYVARNQEGGSATTMLQLRRLDSLGTQRLAGTEGGRQPFFSPDGQWVGFFNETGELKKISLAGGNAVTIAENLNGSQWGFGVWLDNRQILFHHPGISTIQQVSADGGAITDLLPLDTASGETTHGRPFPIPDTDVILFSVARQVENEVISSLEAFFMETGERRLVQEGIAGGRYLDSGHLVFIKDQILMVAPFDPVELTFTGSAVPMVDNIRRDGGSGEGSTPQLTVSRNGTLAYAPPVDSLRQLYYVNRDGSSEALDILPDRYTQISVSPNGRYAALEVDTGADSEIRLHDFSRGTTTRLSQAERDHSATWSPDSQTLVVTSFDSGETGLWQKDLNGQERLLMDILPGQSAPFFRNGSWHPDGRQLAISRQEGGEHDIMLLTFNEGEEGEEGEDAAISMEPLITGATNDYSPRISPDGRWLAYISFKTGTQQIYVRRFPEGEEMIVSTGFRAIEPQWSGDGTELFFMQADENGGEFSITAVEVAEEGGMLSISQPVALFSQAMRNNNGVLESYLLVGNAGTALGVLPDGRFLMARGVRNAFQQEIVLVENWFTELQAMAPVGNLAP